MNFRHGIGTMAYNKKGVYQGYWENGRRHGEGMFTYPNGTWPLEGSGFGAFHFSEVQYIFGVHPENLFAGSFSDEEWTVHDTIRQRWGMVNVSVR